MVFYSRLFVRILIAFLCHMWNVSALAYKFGLLNLTYSFM